MTMEAKEEKATEVKGERVSLEAKGVGLEAGQSGGAGSVGQQTT
jgi:hypothetical protein